MCTTISLTCPGTNMWNSYQNNLIFGNGSLLISKRKSTRSDRPRCYPVLPMQHYMTRISWRSYPLGPFGVWLCNCRLWSWSGTILKSSLEISSEQYVHLDNASHILTWMHAVHYHVLGLQSLSLQHTFCLWNFWDMQQIAWAITLDTAHEYTPDTETENKCMGSLPFTVSIQRAWYPHDQLRTQTWSGRQ